MTPIHHNAAEGGPTSADATRTLTPDLEVLAERLKTVKGAWRMLYVPGPGDVRQSYLHWAAGRDDPSILAVAYSQQVYEVAAQSGAVLATLTEQPVAPDDAQPRADTRFLQCRHLGGRGLSYHFLEVVYVLRVLAHALRFRADLILFQRQVLHYWPLILAKMFGVELVLSLHNGLWPVHRAPTRLERLIWRWNRHALRHGCRHVICVSKAIRSQLEAQVGPDFKRISVQTPQYPDSLRDAFRQRTSSAHLLYLGRIEANKGVFDLLRAFEQVAPSRPEAELSFVGDGGALRDLNAAVRTSSVAERIHVTGPCDAASVMMELDRSALLVCPTTTHFAEGLAKTPIEAAIMGIPSLVSDNVPCADLLDGAVRVFPADDIDALARALGELLDEPETLERMSAQAGLRREAFFDRRKSLAAQLLQALPSPAP